MDVGAVRYIPKEKNVICVGAEGCGLLKNRCVIDGCLPKISACSGGVGEGGLMLNGAELKILLEA